jgi:hypothetical protein
MSNFEFLRKYDRLWAALGSLAENNHPSDPNTTVTKLRILCEQIAQRIADSNHIDTSQTESFDDLLRALSKVRSVPRHVLDDLHFVRMKGNIGAHDHTVAANDSLDSLRAAFAVAVWFYTQFVDGEFRPSQFATPGTVPQNEKPERRSKDLVHLALNNAEQVMALAMKVQQRLQSFRIQTEELDDAITSSTRRIQAARAPFRLGIAGEMNSGKSTLINAIAGDNVAFVNALEATPLACRIGGAQERYANFVYRDGRNERTTIEEAHARIADRRHDLGWLGSLDRAEFFTPSQRLKDLEIWDSPGIGGSEHNDYCASEFLTDVTGVIWVFDVQFLGNADHIPGLQRLSAARKRIVGVLNKRDLLQDEDVQRALEEADLRYGAYIEEFMALSASAAFAKTIDGQHDSDIDRLQKLIFEQILAFAERDRQQRIDAAVRESAKDLSRVLRQYHREFADRLGFLQHVGHHLSLAQQRTMKGVPALIAESAGVAFTQEFRESEQRLAAFIEREQLGISTPLVDGICSDPPPLQHPLSEWASWGRGKSTKDDLNSILREFDKSSDLNAAYRRAVQSMVERLRVQVDRECLDAVLLSEAAIPSVRVDMSSVKIDLDDAAKASTKKSKALREGFRAAKWVAVLFGVAGFVAPPLWLGVLASVPVGLSVGWRAYVDSELSDFESSRSKLLDLVDRKRSYLQKLLTDNFPFHFEAALASATDDVLQDWSSQLLINLSHDNMLNLSELLADAADLLSRAAVGTTIFDKLSTRPLVVSPDNNGREIWIQLIARTQQRVHILLENPDDDLTSILRLLGPETEVRVVVPYRADVADKALELFQGWEGTHELRCVRSRSTTAPLAYTLIVFDDCALVTHQRVAAIGSRTVSFEDYSYGLKAAERLFAEVWQAKATEFGDLEVVPLSRRAARSTK